MPRMRPRSVIRGDGADSGVDSGVDQGADSGVGAGRLELPAHLTRLRLACCNLRLVQDTGAPASSKLATFAETLDELLANRHKVPMFSQVVKHLKLVEEYLAGAGITFQYLDGATPTKARAERIAAFQKNLLITLAATARKADLAPRHYRIATPGDMCRRGRRLRPVPAAAAVVTGTCASDRVAHEDHDAADVGLVAGVDDALGAQSSESDHPFHSQGDHRFHG